MQVCTKSFLIGQVFKVLDFTSVIKESIDIDADVVQFFKQALASKDVTAEQASVIAYSIYQIVKHSKQDVVPLELFQNLFPLALQCLHTGPLSDKFDGRCLHWFGLMAAQLIRDKNPLASSSKIHIIDRREFTWTNISGGSILLDAFLELE